MGELRRWFMEILRGVPLRMMTNWRDADSIFLTLTKR
jgi:hypothetical protein